MIPALTAKTTALFIDDDASLLRDLCDFLPKTHFFKTFTNPLEALEHIKLQTQPCFSRQESLLHDFKSAQFDTMVSVIIVDHRMTPIDGIEFCQKIESIPSKRIMLTSHATKDLAIRAFNSKLIDAFLLKTEDNILDMISSIIQKCTIDFFKDISAGINGFKSKYNPLVNEDFSKFFFDFCISKKVQSHCCFHDFHNIVLKDNHGKEIYMTIYDDDHLGDMLVSEQAKSAKPHIIDLILSKRAAPCFKDTNTALIPDGLMWENFMVPLIHVTQNLFLATN
jgi:CheY-like chemotaxis protein